MIDLLIVAVFLGCHFFGSGDAWLTGAGPGLAFLWCGARIVGEVGEWVFKMVPNAPADLPAVAGKVRRDVGESV